MIPPAADAFLREHTRTFLVTVRPDGAPACHPMVGFWRNGALYINTYRASAKARNLLAEPRVACVVVTDDDARPFRGVVLRGRAEIADVPAVQRSDRPAVVGHDVADLVQARLAAGKRVLVRIVPDDVRLVGEHG
ncbi:MAG TPA: pyridoxamine 5'-phosphate oxidase family protein [Candidatus Binatia bacterium]|nr:pyridoxamine 5'-phosphate oxidase family protein [Candidatus Binatia bacterium]